MFYPRTFTLKYSRTKTNIWYCFESLIVCSAFISRGIAIVIHCTYTKHIFQFQHYPCARWMVMKYYPKTYVTKHSRNTLARIAVINCELTIYNTHSYARASIICLCFVFCVYRVRFCYTLTHPNTVYCCYCGSMCSGMILICAELLSNWMVFIIRV